MKIRTEIYLGLANPLVRKRTQRGPTNKCPSRTKCMATSYKDSESSPQDISRLCQGVVVDPAATMQLPVAPITTEFWATTRRQGETALPIHPCTCQCAVWQQAHWTELDWLRPHTSIVDGLWTLLWPLSKVQGKWAAPRSMPFHKSLWCWLVQRPRQCWPKP